MSSGAVPDPTHAEVVAVSEVAPPLPPPPPPPPVVGPRGGMGLLGQREEVERGVAAAQAALSALDAVLALVLPGGADEDPVGVVTVAAFFFPVLLRRLSPPPVRPPPLPPHPACSTPNSCPSTAPVGLPTLHTAPRRAGPFLLCAGRADNWGPRAPGVLHWAAPRTCAAVHPNVVVAVSACAPLPPPPPCTHSQDGREPAVAPPAPPSLTPEDAAVVAAQLKRARASVEQLSRVTCTGFNARVLLALENALLLNVSLARKAMRR